MLARLARHPFLQAALVAIIAAAVYLPFLGVRPLDFSEGHRAVPGWTMLESGDYWHVKMFGLTYIRKPPGMAWAIAASSSLLGETPLGARMPSAICAMLMSLLAWWYGKKWFGGGLAAGLAQALMPLMWSPGRTAEIEMLNNLGTQMFALGLLDLLIGRVSRKGAEIAEEGGEESPFAFLCALCASARDILIPAAGLFIAALAKGPSSAPVLGGVLIGACIAAKSFRPLATRGVWLVLLFGTAAILIVGMKVCAANDDPDAVREDVAKAFLWSRERIVGVLTLLPLAFASALPHSLSLFIRRSHNDAAGETESTSGTRASALTWTWLASLAIFLLLGVSDSRYAMPAAVVFPLLIPYTIATLVTRTRSSIATNWPIERLLLLGATRNWAIVMWLVAWWFVVLTSISPTEDQQASTEAARRVSNMIWDGELWADDAIEARPDLLWLIQKQLPRLKVKWAKPEMALGKAPPQYSYVLLRTDSGSQEVARYLKRSYPTGLPLIRGLSVRAYRFDLFNAESFQDLTKE